MKNAKGSYLKKKQLLTLTLVILLKLYLFEKVPNDKLELFCIQKCFLRDTDVAVMKQIANIYFETNLS